MKPGQEASYPAVIQESLIWLKPKSKDATNTTSKDISSFLLRQYDLVEREPTQGLWSEADLVLKSGPITFFLKQCELSGLQFRHLRKQENLCCAGLLCRIRRYKGMCKYPRGNSLWSICCLSLFPQLPSTREGAEVLPFHYQSLLCV